MEIVYTRQELKNMNSMKLDIDNIVPRCAWHTLSNGLYIQDEEKRTNWKRSIRKERPAGLRTKIESTKKLKDGKRYDGFSRYLTLRVPCMHIHEDTFVQHYAFSGRFFREKTEKNFQKRFYSWLTRPRGPFHESTELQSIVATHTCRYFEFSYYARCRISNLNIRNLRGSNAAAVLPLVNKLIHASQPIRYTCLRISNNFKFKRVYRVQATK